MSWRRRSPDEGNFLSSAMASLDPSPSDLIIPRSTIEDRSEAPYQPLEPEDVDILDTSVGAASMASVASARVKKSLFRAITLVDKIRARFRPALVERMVHLNAPGLTTPTVSSYPKNVIRNQKFHWYSFLPLALFEQFRYFFNLFFLVVALSQLIPIFRVGFVFTAVSPLVLVLSVSLSKEAYDDIKRFKRDRAMNSERVTVLRRGIVETVPSSSLRVGDIISIDGGQRLPADCILLQSSDETGASFIKTDQLDGETDWKLRRAPELTQSIPQSELSSLQGWSLVAEAPHIDIYSFKGTLSNAANKIAPLNLDQTMWAGTVLASGHASAVVVYTGTQTRQALNSTRPRAKTGTFDNELNVMTKILFFSVIGLAFVETAFGGFRGQWYLTFNRFVLLFSAIIPISMRVNLDMARTLGASWIQKDERVPGTVVRNSNLPEQLGRVHYLFSDKTGTLTRNEMLFKVLHTGAKAFFAGNDSDLVRNAVSIMSVDGRVGSVTDALARSGPGLTAATHAEKLAWSIRALGLCHSVTPATDNDGHTVYQAASPDEVALVQYADSVGVTLSERSSESMVLTLSDGSERWEILDVFPFSSALQRMGIIVRHSFSKQILFICKGADSIMAKICIDGQDWVAEEAGTLGRDGLRTLVVGAKELSPAEYESYSSSMAEAEASMGDREGQIAAVRGLLEQGLRCICLTGVEDRLQEKVRPTLEALRRASVRIWMLTGDKPETAMCIARSTALVGRDQSFSDVMVKDMPVDYTHDCYLGNEEANSEVAFLDDASSCDPRVSYIKDRLSAFRTQVSRGGANVPALVVDGATLTIILRDAVDGSPKPKSLPGRLFRGLADWFGRVDCGPGSCGGGLAETFIYTAVQAPAVIASRCSPTQKATLVKLAGRYTGNCTASIGDGGNDVSMIQAAHIGIGLEGKEGKQASLASDVSITTFFHLKDLLFWHGRNSYSSSARLSQFIMHRGMIISVMQAVYSALLGFSPTNIFNGWLLMGYTTVFTLLPVFALVLDRDVSHHGADRYPELYSELARGRVLCAKSFAVWALQSVWQGGAMVFGTFLFFPTNFYRLVAVVFTSLIASEFLNFAFEVHNWHNFMVFSLVASGVIYGASMVGLHAYFDLSFVFSYGFLWRLAAITALSVVPVYAVKYVSESLSPSVSVKINRLERKEKHKL